MLSYGMLTKWKQNSTERIENGYGTDMERIQNGNRTDTVWIQNGNENVCGTETECILSSVPCQASLDRYCNLDKYEGSCKETFSI